MIPNLQDLPPIPPDEARSLKRLLRPLSGLLMVLLLAAGIFWFYAVGIKEMATQQADLQSGLEAVASDLWLTGKAPEIRSIDRALTADIAALRMEGELLPSIVVLPSEPLAGRPRSTHELMYLKGKKPVLAVQILVDESEGKLDITGWQVLDDSKRNGMQ